MASSSDELQACLEARNKQNVWSPSDCSLEFVVYRFVLRENIALFQNVLKVETAENVRQTIQGMLRSVKRELAMLESREFGVQNGPWPLTMTHKCLENGAARDTFRVQFGSSSTPYLALDPPGLRIIDRTPSRFNDMIFAIPVADLLSATGDNLILRCLIWRAA